MYGKLVHRPPFGHHCHCHAPRPPFGDPREVGERYLGHPELTDYWIKPYLLEALKHYPRLDDSCVVEGLWTFANSILLKNYKAAKRVPPTFDDPEVTHKIAFLDRDDVELGAIKFWRKVDSTFGIDIKLGNAGISIIGDNDNPSVSLVNTPVNDGPKEIVNVEYLNQALVPFNDALNALADRVEVLEDLYEDQIKPIVTDPNGNTRSVHTVIHADPSDANLPTCGAVYQYGKGISDALNQRIDNLPPVVDTVQDGNMNPVTSNAVADEIANLRAAITALSNSSKGGPRIFFAVANSAQDAAIRAAGFWRCGRGYYFYDDAGHAGGVWYICYAPNGHTITEVDLCWSYSQYVVLAVNGISLPHGGTIIPWMVPEVGNTSPGQQGVDIPTVGMTQANEVPFPANPYLPN